MKKEKLYVSTIIILIITVLILLLALFMMLTTNKDKEETSTSEKENKTDMTVECTKPTDTQEKYTGSEKYIIHVDSKGEVVNYTDQYTTTFNTKEDYESAKNSATDENLQFNDVNRQVILNQVVDKMVNSDGVEIHLWYKDFIQSLINNGFTCNE